MGPSLNSDNPVPPYTHTQYSVCCNDINWTSFINSFSSVTMANLSRFQKYRENLKKDPEKYEDYKKAGKLRVMKSRLNKLKETIKNDGKPPSTEEQRKKWREEGKARRDKKKAKVVQKVTNQDRTESETGERPNQIDETQNDTETCSESGCHIVTWHRCVICSRLTCNLHSMGLIENELHRVHKSCTGDKNLTLSENVTSGESSHSSPPTVSRSLFGKGGRGQPDSSVLESGEKPRRFSTPLLNRSRTSLDSSYLLEESDCLSPDTSTQRWTNSLSFKHTEA